MKTDRWKKANGRDFVFFMPYGLQQVRSLAFHPAIEAVAPTNLSDSCRPLLK